MQHKTGTIGGFVIGMAGFLFLFKLIILDHTPPSEELAPGIAVLASIMNGVLFAAIGRRIQDHLSKRTSTTESR